ncbi:MAG: glucodextranase DOMON-like domain-containing protein, partial [Candidatus Latescibacterota bacterium]
MQRIVIILILISVIVSLPLARPFKSPVIDGRITGDGTDWDKDDLAVDDPLGDTAWGPNEIDDLWVTYDSLNLYIGVRYQVNNNAMLTLIDAGTGTGASDINGLDWYPRNFNFPDSLRAGYLIANWNGSPLGVRRIANNTTTQDITLDCQTANQTTGNFFYEAEVRIPWNSIYQLGPGLVLPGARVKLVSLIAGGDNWNGPDSAPDNPGMNGSGAKTLLSNLFTIVVDSDGDGYPDGFSGAVAGTVEYEDPLDAQTVATIKAIKQSTNELIAETVTAPGGGPYRIDRLPDGSYKIEVTARGYGKVAQSGLVISGQNTLSNIDFFMNKTGKVTGDLVFRDGPGSIATVTAFESVTGEIAGEGPVEIPATGGSYELLLPDGTYLVTAEAAGYIAATVTAVVQNSDSSAADTLGLYAVRASKLLLIDNTGEVISSINTTVSFPDSGIYFFATARIEARDAMGRRDLYNLGGYLNQVNLTATKLNNLTPPRGDVTFYGTDTIPTTSIALTQGRGSFMITDDEVEVLRVFTTTQQGNITGRFKLGIRSTEPEYLELHAASKQITADGLDEVVIEARLLDISRNPVRISGVPVSFTLAASTTGKGTYKIPSALTSADGEVSSSLLATKTGKLHVTASATYLNKNLTVLGEDGNDYIEIIAVPGPAASIRLSAESDVVGVGQSMRINAQLIDSNGNAVSSAGHTVNFSYSPPAAGSLSPLSVVLDANGHGTTTFVAGSGRSVVEVKATSNPSIPVKGTTFLIDKILLFSDPKAPEPAPGPNSFTAMDLTTVTIGNGPQAIEINVKFATNWDGAHLGIILETANTPSGAPGDPFGFPITYGHALKPEFALTYKYSSDDYADLRKWDGSQWLWWDNDGLEYRSEAQGWVEGVNIRSAWIAKDTAFVKYLIPLAIFEGSIPDSIRLQVYLMQEADEQKRSAFDSSPSDATLDLDFDPADPNADWSLTLAPVTLTTYAPPYAINQVFPDAPVLVEPKVTPASVQAGEMVLFTVQVQDAGDGIGDILIDLTPLGGPRFQPMRDDGTNGDAAPGDGKYSYRYMVDPDIGGGDYPLIITGKDGGNISRSTAQVVLTVEGASAAIRTVLDAVDDDHGPNLFGFDGLYYLYPTNSVFVQRAFDLEEVTIFETSKIVAGEIIPSLAFQVHMGNLPNPADEGTADWNPLYADINIQKIDIYIDAFRGGATEGLPNRQNDFAKWDAWDYAIVMEGWYKSVITSNSQNTPQAWTATTRKSDRDIILLSDFNQNTITAVVSKEALGNPSNEDILNWDLTVLMTSHDGNSDDNNFGDTRWVNSSSSEWNPGGGSDTDRDPNILDLITSPGLGKKPGRVQSVLLNYKSAEAVARSENGQTAAVLEATAFEDQGPPVIDIGLISQETVPFTALINAPLYFTAIITDDDQVSSATFRWRADSSSTGAWFSEIAMGYAGSDLWSIDLPIDEVTANVPI